MADSFPLREPPALSTWRPHVTVAVVVACETRFLLVEEEVHARRVLNQPAGHLEPGETLQQAALRETLEETRWHVRLECFLGVQQWRSPAGRDVLRFSFGAEALREDPALALDTGIVRAVWLTRAEIEACADRLRSPMVLTSIDSWLHRPHLPLDTVRALGGLA